MAQAMSDGILTRQEEERLRTFRDNLALENNSPDSKTLATLDRASSDRLIMEARLAAISVHDGDDHLQDLDEAMLEARLGPDQRKRILIRAWETAVEGALEDGLVSLDEENALAKYADHFALTQKELDGNRAQTSLVQAAVIRDVAQGIVPQRQNINGAIPFNLMKSEKLVWVIQDVDYLETVVRRERRGTSHGLSIRVARGLYYRPSTFRSRPIEWEETVHADTGLLGPTTKHIYYAGSRKKFRVRYDRIVSFDPYEDGLGIMRDAQTAKPQTFRTGDGWFACNMKEDFRIDLEAGTCTCPAGQATRIIRPSGTRTDPTGRTHRLQGFRFDGAVCGVCPLRSQCVAAKPGTGRTVQLHPQEALLQ